MAKANRVPILLSLLAAVLFVPAASLAAGSPGPLIGQPFPVSAVPAGEEDNVAVAYDRTRRRFLLVFENDDALMAACVDAHGPTLATYVLAASDGKTPTSYTMTGSTSI